MTVWGRKPIALVRSSEAVLDFVAHAEAQKATSTAPRRGTLAA